MSRPHRCQSPVSPTRAASPPLPWAVGVIITPYATTDRHRRREQRMTVAVEAYKLGYFLADTLSVSAEHAAVDLDDIRALATWATADALIVLDTCAGDSLIDLAVPESMKIYTLTPRRPHFVDT